MDSSISCNSLIQFNDDLLQKEAKAAASLGIPAFFTREAELPFMAAGNYEKYSVYC